MLKKAILVVSLSLSAVLLTACGQPSQPFCDRLDRNVKAEPGVNCIPVVGNTKGSS